MTSSKQRADTLFETLSPLVRDIDPPVETSTWPYLQIALPLETFERIRNEAPPDTDAQINLIKESARVSVAEGKVLNIEPASYRCATPSAKASASCQALKSGPPRQEKSAALLLHYTLQMRASGCN